MIRQPYSPLPVCHHHLSAARHTQISMYLYDVRYIRFKQQCSRHTRLFLEPFLVTFFSSPARSMSGLNTSAASNIFENRMVALTLTVISSALTRVRALDQYQDIMDSGLKPNIRCFSKEMIRLSFGLTSPSWSDMTVKQTRKRARGVCERQMKGKLGRVSARAVTVVTINTPGVSSSSRHTQTSLCLHDI